MEDLHTFIETLESHFPSEILRITETVTGKYDTTTYAVELEKKGKYPVLMFENVKNSNFQMVSNIFASRERLARMLGGNIRNLYDVWNEKLNHLIKPESVSSGPIKQIRKKAEEINLYDFPIPTHFEGDAGPYVTAGIVVAKDPETGRRNMSYHRMQLKSKNRVGLSLHSRGHLWDFLRRAEKKGKDLDVAVFIGAHPLVYLAASAKVPVDEYEVAGAFMSRPVKIVKCETVDLEVPAHADIAIEGRILRDFQEPEGPFCEYTGYMTSRSTRNVLEISAVTHRKDAYFQDIVPGPSSEHLLLGGVGREAGTSKTLKEVVPYVKDLNYPSSGTHFHCYISMEKVVDGQPQQVLALLFGLDPYVKLAVVVDDDIDIYDERQVLWAMATRMQADEDVLIIPKMLCNVLDPSSSEGMSAKLGVDATKPLTWKTEKCRIPKEIIDHVKRKLKKFGL